MQYILDEAEMAEIRALRTATEKLPRVEVLEAHCRFVADQMIQEGRDHPYGCIHGERERKYGYCDKCPVLSICPMPKDF